MLRDGEDKGSGCAASSSSQHPDLLICTGAGATGALCGYAVMTRTAYFMCTASKALGRNRKRNSGIFHLEGTLLPLTSHNSSLVCHIVGKYGERC